MSESVQPFRFPSVMLVDVNEGAGHRLDEIKEPYVSDPGHPGEVPTVR